MIIILIVITTTNNNNNNNININTGLKSNERSQVQEQWMKGVVPIIVATISFGMGVDKANVRYV